MEFTSKTELYHKIKKPEVERQRRARINKCLDAIKRLLTELNDNKSTLRMDKTEILESTVTYLRSQTQQGEQLNLSTVNNFRNGYINAVNEVSRVLASTAGLNVDTGKSIMIHLGRSYNKLQQQYEQDQVNQDNQTCLAIVCPPSPTSSGYCSDSTDSSFMSSPIKRDNFWRPW